MAHVYPRLVPLPTENKLYINLVLGIGQENHNRLSEELNRLIIDLQSDFYLPCQTTYKGPLKRTKNLNMYAVGLKQTARNVRS